MVELRGYSLNGRLTHPSGLVTQDRTGQLAGKLQRNLNKFTKYITMLPNLLRPEMKFP